SLRPTPHLRPLPEPHRKRRRPHLPETLRAIDGEFRSMIFPLYVLGKYLAYSLWCYLGLRWLRDRKSVGAGFGYGSARLGLGMIFGVGIFFLIGMMQLHSPAPWWTYVAVYVPVRYVEWSILAALLGTSGG